jgi:hypothetical protein
MAMARRAGSKNASARTLAFRLKQRAAGNRNAGMPENWAVDALDCYLDGMTFKDIATCMGCSLSVARNAVMTEALYRMMALRAAERVEELKEEMGTKP